MEGGVAVSEAQARLADLVGGAGSVVALTGAGISVPSGIPDFRCAGHRPVGERRPDGGRAHRRLPCEPGALLELLRRTLRDAVGQEVPNGAHAALVELERRGILDGVITQNVDMLHTGRPATRELVEVHGSIAKLLVPGLRRDRVTPRARGRAESPRTSRACRAAPSAPVR